MDHLKLLTAYIEYVGRCEGTTFLNRIRVESDLAELGLSEDEARFLISLGHRDDPQPGAVEPNDRT